MHILNTFRFNIICLDFYTSYYVIFLTLVHILHKLSSMFSHMTDAKSAEYVQFCCTIYFRSEKYRELWGGCFHITVYCLFKREREKERERERDRETDRQSRESSCFLCYGTLEFLTLTITRFKTETKKFKEKTEEAACVETATKFSISSLCPKFLQLSMRLSLLVT